MRKYDLTLKEKYSYCKQLGNIAYAYFIKFVLS